MDALTDLTVEQLADEHATRVARIKEIQALPALTAEDVKEAKDLNAERLEIETEQTVRVEAQAELDADIEAIKALDFDPPAEPVAEVVEPVVEAEPVAEVAEPVAEVAEPVAAAVTPSARAALGGQRPNIPETPVGPGYTITASSGHAALELGQQVSLAEMGQAAVAKLEAMPEPAYDGKGNLDIFALGNLSLDFPDDLKITPQMSTEDIDAVFRRAGDERRLEGESLTASAGWCAPSEQLYNLPNHEIVDGILSVPEVQVNRGGFKHSTGLDWATLYSGVGFTQTESQAISGTSKTFYEVPCPSFTDERLDAIGLGIKVPILLEAGYPEMVANVMSRSMVAHQYKVNASVISRIQTAAGSARNFTVDLGSSVVDSLSGINLVLTQLRQKYRIGQNATLEVMLPVWAKEVFREDLSARNGRPKDAVTDEEINAHFTVRGANVQYVYGYQELTTSALIWPANLEFIAWPAGTFVKGVSNVINLSAVYDAASLAVNLYTGLFFEQGLLVATMDYEAVRGTIPTNQAGRTGAANLT